MARLNGGQRRGLVSVEAPDTTRFERLLPRFGKGYGAFGPTGRPLRLAAVMDQLVPVGGGVAKGRQKIL
ncbi:MAG: hypothetical protein P8010_07515, partial [Desulfosarcinaceae bacterium]